MFKYTSKALTTLVTYLEMTTPPKASPPRPANIQTALMRTQHMPLHFYRYLQHQVGEPYHWVYRLRLSDEELSKLIHAKTTDIDVLYINGVPSGFYEIDRSDSNKTDISYFGMMPHGIGKGLGKWFLSQAINAAWENEPKSITVNTCTLDHPAALGLYQKMGFQAIRRQDSKIVPLSKSERLSMLG